MRPFLLQCSFLTTVLLATLGVSADGQTFTNPVIARGADPSVVFRDGIYYSVQSGCPHPGSAPVICIRSSPSLAELGKSTPVILWTSPATGPNSADIWAPQIDVLDGKFHIYYAAGSAPGLNDHRLFALVPGTPGEPLKPWIVAPTGDPNGALTPNWKSVWGIDPDVFLASDHRYYLLYACRQDNTGSRSSKEQSICLSEMTDPLHLTGQTVALSHPVQPWETRTFPTQEGPFGFVHDGTDYILYSASFSGTADDYAEALLVNDHPPQPEAGGNPLTNPASWIKQGPIFDGHHASYGTASNVTVPSPDGTELWNVYHGTDCLKDCPMVNRKTWRDRSIRAQRAGWAPDGSLVMGYPVDIVNLDQTGVAVPLELPSTHGAGTMTLPAWGAAFGDAAEGNAAHGQPTGAWNSSGPSSVHNIALDPNRFDRTFFGANPNWQDYVLYTRVRLIETGTGDPHPKFGVYGAYVDRENYFIAMIDVTSCGRPGCLATDGVVAGVNRGWQNCPLPAGLEGRKENTLAIEAVNGTFTILLNGMPLTGGCQGRQFALSQGQSPLHGSNGQVGVIVQNTKAEYTSFGVSPGVPVEGRIYAFRNLASRMNLSLSCESCDPKAAGESMITQLPAAAPYPLTASPAQLWTVHARGSGYFAIANILSGLCVDSPPAPSRSSLRTTRATGMLTQNPCNDSPSQQWQFLPLAESSSFAIQNRAFLQVVSSADAWTAKQIQLQPSQNAASQKWQLVVP